MILIFLLGTFRVAVASGTSTGIYEALELRDKDPAAYHGKGAECAPVATICCDLKKKDIHLHMLEIWNIFGLGYRVFWFH